MVRRSKDDGLRPFDKKVLPVLEKYGWYVLSVSAQPEFSYSIGLYEHFQHPEIIVFGLASDTAHALINNASKRIREGQIFTPGRKYGGLVADCECEFRHVEAGQYDGHLNYAMWYYEDLEFPAIQLVWPDEQGRFPWDAGFEETLRKYQPLLENPKATTSKRLATNHQPLTTASLMLIRMCHS